MANVMIAGRSVGARQPVFMVAEAGVNHDGSPDKALCLVDAAKAAGADAVKFQMFRAADLVTAQATPATYQRRGSGSSSQREMLARLELAPEAFERIKRRCDEQEIFFLATPFGLKEVARVQALGAVAIKIASTDLSHSQLVDAAMSTGLPLILSTGAATEEEIHAAVERVGAGGAHDRLTLLHCVSCYPTPLEAANLGAIGRLAQTFHVPCGLSDHTTETRIGAWAVAAGACMLEKHFTLDPSAPGPDHAMSLGPAQLAEYVSAVRRAEQAMGDGGYGMTSAEADVRLVAGRSVVAATRIHAGTRLTQDMLALKRPGGGIPARDLERLWGRRAATDINSDTMLAWDMVR